MPVAGLGTALRRQRVDPPVIGGTPRPDVLAALVLACCASGLSGVRWAQECRAGAPPVTAVAGGGHGWMGRGISRLVRVREVGGLSGRRVGASFWASSRVRG